MKKINIKIVFVFIGLLLLGFFGSGIYLCMNHIFGAGFIGLGFGLVGLGVTCVLADGILFGVVSSDDDDVHVTSSVGDVNVLSDAILTVNRCTISRDGSDKAVKDAGVISVFSDGVYLSQLYPTPLKFLFSDVTVFQLDGNAGCRIGGRFSIGGSMNDGLFTVKDAPPIQMKVFATYMSKQKLSLTEEGV